MLGSKILENYCLLKNSFLCFELSSRSPLLSTSIPSSHTTQNVFFRVGRRLRPDIPRRVAAQAVLAAASDGDGHNPRENLRAGIPDGNRRGENRLNWDGWDDLDEWDGLVPIQKIPSIP